MPGTGCARQTHTHPSSRVPVCYTRTDTQAGEVTSPVHTAGGRARTGCRYPGHSPLVATLSVTTSAKVTGVRAKRVPALRLSTPDVSAPLTTWASTPSPRQRCSHCWTRVQRHFLKETPPGQPPRPDAWACVCAAPFVSPGGHRSPLLVVCRWVCFPD